MTSSSPTTSELCALISGGFVVAGSQCVVAIECAGKPECEMIAVESVTPDEAPDKLLEKLSKEVAQPPSGLTVTVYGICGGIHGKPQVG